MDYKAIVNLMKEMNQTDLTKLELESDGVYICMEKGNEEQVTYAQYPLPQVSAPVATPITQAPMTVSAQTIAPASTPAIVPEQKAEETTGRKILSPMVGTFYAQPSPDKQTFVKVGDKVKKGQTLCIIEAMKLMNEIESEYDGEIIEVLVKSEDMVEFGQPLFIIN